MKVNPSKKNLTATIAKPEFHATESFLSKRTTEEHLDYIYNSLYDYFRNYTKLSLSTLEQTLIRAAFKLKNLRRRQFLVQEGEICKYICYVISGALRIYSLNERGQEAIVAFALEGNWISDWESLVEQSSSRYYIDAIENSEILYISPAKLHALEAEIVAISEFLRLEQRFVAVTTQKRIHNAISMTAEERYQDLQENHPEYFQKFSQNMIASYLGIKPETLSRLRRR